ncbi:MAG: hypothetical protein DI538_08220 [Azospira oryzae]|jgi:hypothetical protein|nr:MAG: hypothetical protein DI538_08220 [Azospira oryzae]
MLHDLTQDERRLAELMSDISARCYGAGWMSGLEYVLWDAVVCGPRNYGQGEITGDDLNRLIQVSDKTNSWILFDHELEEVSIPLDEWKIKFAEETTQNPDRLYR